MTWQIQQRINFYLAEFRPPVLPPPVRRLLVLLGLSLLLLCLAALALLGYRQWLLTEQQQTALVTQRLTQQLEEERARRPLRVADAALQQQLQEARQQLANSQKIWLYLGREQLQQSQSFTPLIAQLGEQQVSGIWLQGFTVHAAGQQIRLQGFVDEPSKLSRYVTGLLQRSAYAGKSFRQIDVQRTERRWMSFVLDTEMAADQSSLPASQSAERQADSGRRL